MTRGYADDEDKALQCHHFTPLPHHVIQKILQAYEFIDKTCKVTLQKINENLHLQIPVHVKSNFANLRFQRLIACLEKPYCGKSQQGKLSFNTITL